jgi:hypothetical protein
MIWRAWEYFENPIKAQWPAHVSESVSNTKYQDPSQRA